MVAVAGHPTDPSTFYFGACAGGVWKTTDGGVYWENVSDGFFETSAVASPFASTHVQGRSRNSLGWIRVDP